MLIAEGAAVISGGATNKDGFLPKGVDEARCLEAHPGIFQNLKAPPSVNGVERLAEVQKDAEEGHPLTGGELLEQRRLHGASVTTPLGAKLTQKIMEHNLRQPLVQHPL